MFYYNILTSRDQKSKICEEIVRVCCVRWRILNVVDFLNFAISPESVHDSFQFEKKNFFFLFWLRNFVREVYACGTRKFNNRIAMLKRTMIGLKHYASFVSPRFTYFSALYKNKIKKLKKKNTADFILTREGKGIVVYSCQHFINFASHGASA